jgi:hypothetical protein
MGEWLYGYTYSLPRLEVCVQLHAPATLPPGKEHPVPFRKEGGRTPDAVRVTDDTSDCFVPSLCASLIYSLIKVKVFWDVTPCSLVDRNLDSTILKTSTAVLMETSGTTRGALVA